jgi:hypothetical protein
MSIELPDQLKEDGKQIYVTLLLPEDSPMPTIDGQWKRREDGNIEASYTRYQLRQAVWAGLVIKIGQVEDRLERGEQMIREAQEAGERERAEELGRHYAALLEEIARLLDAEAQCRASFD